MSNWERAVILAGSLATIYLIGRFVLVPLLVLYFLGKIDGR